MELVLCCCLLLSTCVQAHVLSSNNNIVQQQRHTVNFDTSFQPIDDLSSTLSVQPTVLLGDSPLLHSTGLQRRTAIDVLIATATVVSHAFTAIAAANSALELYNDIAAKIKAKSDANSCTLIFGTEYDDGYFSGYAFKATTTGKNCDTTALKKTILKAVNECANKLHDAKAVAGCCKFTHGGTWTGHLRLTANPDHYPAKNVDC